MPTSAEVPEEAVDVAVASALAQIGDDLELTFASEVTLRRNIHEVLRSNA